jgi:hypothetical protein
MARSCARNASVAVFLFAMSAACTPQEHQMPGDQGGHSGSGGSGPTSGSGGRSASGSGGSSSASGGSGAGGSGGTASGGSSGSTGSGGKPAMGSGGASGGQGGSPGGAGGASADASSAPETGAPAAGPKLSTDVLPIVKEKCARSGCHDPMKKEHGMDVSTAAGIMAGWVNKVTADHCMKNAAVTRVVPFKPENSFVVTLIRAVAGRCDEVRRMPPLPLPPLSPDEVKTITEWVAAGALNN